MRDIAAVACVTLRDTALHVRYGYCIAFCWRLAFHFTVIIWPNTTFCYCLKFFITGALEYEANLIVHFLATTPCLYCFFWCPTHLAAVCAVCVILLLLLHMCYCCCYLCDIAAVACVTLLLRAWYCCGMRNTAIALHLVEDWPLISQ